MENINNNINNITFLRNNLNKNLTYKQKLFFIHLSQYLDKKIYFYGSIIRNDYFIDSDIDIVIFTDNLYSTKTKLQHFLKVNKNKIKKIFWRDEDKNIIINGYKTMYSLYDDNNIILKTEISIYDIKNKNYIIKEHYYKSILPFYVSFLLFIIKILFYKLKFINLNTYKYYKHILLSYFIGKNKEDFLTLVSL